MSNEIIEQIEHEIKAVDVTLMLLRRDSSSATSLEEKLAIMKHTRYVEGMRSHLRKRLFARMDEEDARATLSQATP